MIIDNSNPRLIRLCDVRLFAVECRHGEVFELNDNLYFFEEEGITDVSGNGHNKDYQLFIELPDDR